MADEPSGAVWIPLISSVVTAILGGIGIQASAWWKARQQKQNKNQASHSEYEMAKMSEDGDAQRRLVQFLRERLEETEIERDKVKEIREKLTERNIKLSRSNALTNWYCNMLVAYIKQNNLPVPTRPLDDDQDKQEVKP